MLLTITTNEELAGLIAELVSSHFGLDCKIKAEITEGKTTHHVVKCEDLPLQRQIIVASYVTGVEDCFCTI
jgi:hypothetical protein